MELLATESVRSIFDEKCHTLPIDIKLVKRLIEYEQNFVNKNDQHIAFFGSNLLGVNVVRFTDVDRDRWFSEILEMDEYTLKDAIHELPSINTEWIVSSDIMNLSCVWLTHKIKTSSKLNDKQKEEGMIMVMLILQYKFFTSRYYRHFPFPAQKPIAEAHYNSLSGKYLIKKEGSWHAVFLYRAKEIVGSTSIHRRTIEKMDKDEDVIDMLADIQGRIRGMLRNLYDEYLQVAASGKRIVTTSLILEHDGESILKDKRKSASEYYRYITSVITDSNSFIRQELVAVIIKMLPTMPENMFRETLEWMSTNYRQHGAELIDTVVHETLIHSIDYLSKHREAIRNKSDLPAMLLTLRGGYMSSRSTDQSLIALREQTEVIVKMATSSKNSSTIAAVRTGILLYLVLRSYTMQHYTHQ